MRLFWAIVAIKNWVAIRTDAVNALAQPPPPAEPTFMRIDPQMREWLQEQKGVKVEEGDVHPVICALQGHPKYGSLWAEKVNSYILGDLQFITTVHEPCLYIGVFAKQPVTIGWQVDEFKVAALSVDTSHALINFLQSTITIEVEMGIVSHYNGIDIVKAHDKTYMLGLTSTHCWWISLIEPIHPRAILELEDTDPPVTLAEASILEKAAGFPYHNTVDKLLYN
jgi:hypothetical protein